MKQYSYTHNLWVYHIYISSSVLQNMICYFYFFKWKILPQIFVCIIKKKRKNTEKKKTKTHPKTVCYPIFVFSVVAYALSSVYSRGPSFSVPSLQNILHRVALCPPLETPIYDLMFEDCALDTYSYYGIVLEWKKI